MKELRLENVSRAFYQSGGPSFALENINLVIEPGEFVVIRGHSGAGKSTLLNILGCLDKPSSGSYTVGGQDISVLDNNGLALLRNETFGYIFQSFELLKNISVEENIRIPHLYIRRPLTFNMPSPSDLLDMVAMSQYKSALVTDISGGQKQRVAICRALANDADIIIADEPTASLDAKMAEEIMQLFHRLNEEGKTIILSSHDKRTADYASRVISLRDGRTESDEMKLKVEATDKCDASAYDLVRTQKISGKSFNRVVDALKISSSIFYSNLARNLLTASGITVAVVAFILMSGLVDGRKTELLELLNSRGGDILFVSPSRVELGTGQAGSGALTANDLQVIASVEGVGAVSPVISDNVNYRLGTNELKFRTVGCTPVLFAIRNRELFAGRYFSDHDYWLRRPVAVVSIGVANALFSNASEAVGQNVIANNSVFEIVGVIEPEVDDAYSREREEVVYVPLESARSRLFFQSGFEAIDIKVASGNSVFKVADEIEESLENVRDRSSFRLHNMAEIIQLSNQANDSLTSLLASISVVSLIVGGVGIMNVMTISALERQREFGIRLAYGAYRRDIVILLTSEALILSIIGGVIGAVIGFVLLFFLSVFSYPISFSIDNVFVPLCASCFFGAMFSFWPAIKASLIAPVDLLRNN
ncbi:ABC transporter permease [uncultured Celeribacter sp.]|uniref:ABC transporter permease n=1 Tax=uncultured Celeribacter sp. TaxID=1303376 RepID=UPI002AA68B8B|nr:ABC transporter permease [uncultured Celeribacter sp.]